jgi:hypothetical protein
MAMRTHSGDRTEGRLAKAIEEQTSKLPSDVFLWTALGCLVGSVALTAGRKKEAGSIVGQFAPTLLILGLYNKIVKVAGHSRDER